MLHADIETLLSKVRKHALHIVELQSQQASDRADDLFSAENMLILVDEVARLQKKGTFLKEQLKQIAYFNPDWDSLEISTARCKEITALFKASQHENTVLRHVLNELCKNDAGLTSEIRQIEQEMGRHAN